MRVLVVGATGPLGREVIEVALQAGHDTVALVRDRSRAALPAAAELCHGDVLDADSLLTPVRGADVVICALGTPSPRQASTLLRDGTAHLVAAMKEAQVTRLVCVTLLGTGQSLANTSLLYRHVVLRVLAPMVPDKEAQEAVVRASDLDWTLIRPPRFSNGRARGRVRVIAENAPGRAGHVVRRDLARFLVDCGTGDLYSRQAVAVGS